MLLVNVYTHTEKLNLATAESTLKCLHCFVCMGLGMLSIEVRRECLLEDALKEAKKTKFSPMKVLKVRHMLDVC